MPTNQGANDSGPPPISLSHTINNPIIIYKQLPVDCYVSGTVKPLRKRSEPAKKTPTQAPAASAKILRNCGKPLIFVFLIVSGDCMRCERVPTYLPARLGIAVKMMPTYLPLTPQKEFSARPSRHGAEDL